MHNYTGVKEALLQPRHIIRAPQRSEQDEVTS
jgi:hypothetical protein